MFGQRGKSDTLLPGGDNLAATFSPGSHWRSPPTPPGCGRRTRRCWRCWRCCRRNTRRSIRGCSAREGMTAAMYRPPQIYRTHLPATNASTSRIRRARPADSRAWSMARNGHEIPCIDALRPLRRRAPTPATNAMPASIIATELGSGTAPIWTVNESAVSPLPNV